MHNQNRSRVEMKVIWNNASNMPGTHEFHRNINGNVGSATEISIKNHGILSSAYGVALTSPSGYLSLKSLLLLLSNFY
jgi:hypothetical protein